MAISNSKPHLFLLAIFVFFLLLLNKVNASDSLSFTFANFGSDLSDIIFQGDALQSGATIQLTKTDEYGNPVTNSAGRALYSTPVHLWEESTGRLASFYTSFTFLINGATGSQADGLTFFIAPPDSDIPSPAQGGFLALFNDATAFNTSLNQIVAVEFDTYTNEWDSYPGTNFPHLGIDVNTIQSATTTAWQISDGSVANVRISYDSVSKTLSATLSYPNSAGIQDATVSYVGDLRADLPEWVRVGFSAATGYEVETHNVLSWSFTSNLQSSSALKKKIKVARSVI